MILNIRVKTRCSKQGIRKVADYYEVDLKSSPKQNKANLELIKLISEDFKVPTQKIRIRQGHKSKNKTVEIIG